MKRCVMNKSGQVWIETVIYTLIAFVMIGAVLTFVKPKIEEMQDSALIEQSIEMIKELDNTVRDVSSGAAGNRRLIELSIKKGTLEINPEKNELSFILESNFMYSEHGLNITNGNLIINTQNKNDYNIITIRRTYEDDYNITYMGSDTKKSLGKTTTPYKIFISNNGGTEKLNIDFEVK